MLEKNFKVWDKTEKQWIELTGDVFLAYINGKFEVIEGDERSAEEIENVEIVQYAGIKDKNKNRIYEGNIVKRTSMAPGGKDFIGKVIFDECAYWLDNGKERISLFTEVDCLEVIKGR